jgi:hypothetical protein
MGGTFNYSSLVSGPAPTLSAFVQSLNSEGTVVVNGVDTAQPTTPFTFFWGDGSSTSGFFPQQHTYSDASRNYVVTVTATENTGTSQQFAFPIFLTAPSVTPQTLPNVSFQIPSQPIHFGTHYSYPPPTGETVFSDSAFPVYTRASMQYILSCAAAIDQELANGNVYLLSGVFAIDMLENTSFGGGYSFWYTTPMSVGYGLPVLTPQIQWFILFNEIGKDTTLNTPVTFPFGGNTDGSASEIYSETMGAIFSYATGYEVVNNAATYGISNDVALDIGNSMLIGAANLKANYDAYVAAGAPFSSWNPYYGGPDPTLGTLSALAWKFIEHAELQGLGYRTPAKRLMTLLQLFSPSMLASYDPQDNTQAGATFRSTLMVTALSYAFSEDLRSEFGALNFPIDDAVYEQLYNQATVFATGQSASISLSVGQANFTYTVGGTVPAPESISISNPGGGTLAWSASSNSSWLSVTPSGAAPSTLTVTVIPAGLSTGPHMGTITITAPGATNSPLTIPVSLMVNSGAGPPVISSASLYVPVSPCRIADTRNTKGPFGGPAVTGGTSRDFAIPLSACSIPCTAAAYSLNVAVVPRGQLGYLTVWPAGQSQPVVATLNSLDGRIKSNAAIVPAGANGAISVFATDTTDVILDINGCFVPGSNPAALQFHPLTPCRIADTRNADGPLGGPSLTAQSIRSFPIAESACGVPPSAQAYSLNFSAVPNGPLGYLTVWAAGQPQPVVASLNAVTGTITANAVIVPAGAGQAVDVYTTNDTDLVIDINGYFGPPGSGGLSLYAITPCRVLDTRQPAGTPPFSTPLNVDVTASVCGVPATAQAFVFNATVVPPGPLGYLTMWPEGMPQPLVSTLNALDGAITNNMAIVPTNNGSIAVFPSNPTQLVLDVFSFFAP